MSIDTEIITCISCGLVDDKVEAGGIYYCPNPFCTASGSTNWKIENLNTRRIGSSIEVVNYDGWLEKGVEKINNMPFELGNKIMQLNKTKEIITKLKTLKAENKL